MIDLSFDHAGNPQPPNPEQFYSAYLEDYFLYKLETLIKIVDKCDQLKDVLLEDVSDVDDSDYLRTIKLEIRSAYYHATEKLFELIFGLQPRRGAIENSNLWYYLTTSNCALTH